MKIIGGIVKKTMLAWMMLAVLGVMAGEAKWIGSNPRFVPEIDFSRAKWVDGAKLKVEVPSQAGEQMDLKVTARKPFKVFVNGSLVYRWTGHVYSPRPLRGIYLTPYLRGTNTVIEIADGGGVLAVVRRDGKVIASSSSAWGGGQMAQDDREQVDLREELVSPAFAKRFRIAKPVDRTELQVTGLGFVEAYLDGEKIGDHLLEPAPTDYEDRVLFTTYSLPKINPGEHSLMLLLGHGWYDMRTASSWNFDSAPWRDRPKAWAKLVIKYADGTREEIATDRSWQQVESSIVYDCIREGAVMRGGAFGRSLGCNAVEVAPPKGRMVAAEGLPATKVMKVEAPEAIMQVDGGWQVTFPKTISGYVRLRVKGAAKNDIITIRYDENLGLDGGPAAPSDPYSGHEKESRSPGRRSIDAYFHLVGSYPFISTKSGMQTDHFIASGSAEEEFEPKFVYHGFRHAYITGLKRPLAKEDVVACEIRTAFRETGKFECSDATFTELVRMALNSYRANFATAFPTDCPHREKLGWTGDAWIASEMGQLYFDNEPAYVKWLQDIIDTQKESGEICCIAPTSGWGFEWGNGVVFDSALGQLPWNLWMFRGNRKAVEMAYEPLVKYLAYEKMRETSPDLVANGLGDWNAKDRKKQPTDEYVISCMYMRMREIAAEFASLKGDQGAAKEFKAAAERTRRAIRAKYAKGNGVYDNGRQTAQALAIMFDLAEGPSDRKVAGERLVEAVHAMGDHFDGGLVGSKYIYRALSAIGETELAYRMIVNPTEPSMTKWQGKNGTLWEDWTGGFSKCHIMLGDFAAWAMEYVAGLGRPIKPGSRKVMFKPHPIAALDWARAETEIKGAGTAKSEWRRESERIICKFITPPGVAGEVELPDGRKETIGPDSQLTITCEQGARAMVEWPAKLFTNVPKAFPANEYRTNGVEAAFLEGLTYHGRPTRIFCYYGVPHHAPGEKIPGMVLVHGGLGSAFQRWVKFWNDRGYAAISMDTCGAVSGNTIGNEHSGHYHHADGGPVGWGGYDQLKEDIRDQWMYHAVADVIIANTYLRSLTGVDADRIGLTGVSWGAVINCVVAAVDERFQFVAPVYGCGAFMRDSQLGRGAKFPGFDWQTGVAKWEELWDPINYLPRVKMPICFLAGTEDFAFSLPAMMKSYQAIPGEKHLALKLRLEHRDGAVSERPPEVVQWADHYLKGASTESLDAKADQMLVENSALAVSICAKNAILCVTDKRCGTTCSTTVQGNLRVVEAVRKVNAVVATLEDTDRNRQRKVRYALEGEDAKLRITIDGDGAKKDSLAYPGLFTSDDGDSIQNSILTVIRD